MDQVADQALDAERPDELVFGSDLMRPWIAANLIAFTIGGAVGGAVLRGLLDPAIEQATSRMEVAWIVGTSAAAAALVLGAALGIGQWLVLRSAVPAAWWVPATCIGWAVAGFLSFNSGGASWNLRPEVGPITPLVPNLVLLPVVIVVLGAGQWLVLMRKCVGASWWLLANVGALFVAFFVGFGVAKIVPFVAPTDFPSAKALVIVGAVAGPLYGGLTWLFLAQLRRRAA